jgi:hypothetical protein
VNAQRKCYSNYHDPAAQTWNKEIQYSKRKFVFTEKIQDTVIILFNAIRRTEDVPRGKCIKRTHNIESSPCEGGLEYLHHGPASHRRRWKWNPAPEGIAGATLSLGNINTGTWSSRLGVGRKADDLVLWKNIVAKYKEAKTGSNLAESSKEGYGSKSAVLPMMMMMMMMMMTNIPSVPQYVSSHNYWTDSGDNWHWAVYQKLSSEFHFVWNRPNTTIYMKLKPKFINILQTAHRSAHSES